jgi:NADP-dependent 3-hydroxy acid dehydrogenase YdfG
MQYGKIRRSNMGNNIEGKVVVITGASTGLGEAAARLLSEQGATVVLGARRGDLLQALAAELTAAGGKALAVETDVADYAQVKRLVDTAVKTFGRIDVMINNAGLRTRVPLEELDISEWDKMIDVNIKGVLHGMVAALPYMQKQKSGHIINVASVLGIKVIAPGTVYSATKAAIRALSEGLRQEAKPYDIRSTVISPGVIATNEPLISSGGSMRSLAIPADSFARAVSYAISQPDDVDINEIVFRPTKMPF